METLRVPRESPERLWLIETNMLVDYWIQECKIVRMAVALRELMTRT